MSSTIRFYKNKQMEILTMETLLREQREDLISSPRMMELFEYDGTTVYQEDILLLKLEDVPEKSNFWNQNLAKMMKKVNLNQVIIHFTTSSLHITEYRLYLKRDEQFASNNTVNEQNFSSGKRLYEPCFHSPELPYLLLGSGGKIMGNTHEDATLLPGDDCQCC